MTESVDNTGGKAKKMEYTHVLGTALRFISRLLVSGINIQNRQKRVDEILLSDVSLVFVVPDMKAKQFLYYAAKWVSVLNLYIREYKNQGKWSSSDLLFAIYGEKSPV